MSTRPNRQTKRNKDSVTLPVLWKKADNIPTVYANQLIISHATQGEFFLFFGEMTPPATVNPADYPEYLEVTPVAKIAISPENMLRFAEVIAGNIESFKAKLVQRQEKPK